MYGFGDVKEPNDDTLDLLESYVEDFIGRLLIQAYNRATKCGHKKVKMSDVLYQIRNHEKMYMRSFKLLYNLDSVEKARKKRNMSSKKVYGLFARHLRKKVQKRLEIIREQNESEINVEAKENIETDEIKGDVEIKYSEDKAIE